MENGSQFNVLMKSACVGMKYINLCNVYSIDFIHDHQFTILNVVVKIVYRCVNKKGEPIKGTMTSGVPDCKVRRGRFLGSTATTNDPAGKSKYLLVLLWAS